MAGVARLRPPPAERSPPCSRLKRVAIGVVLRSESIAAGWLGLGVFDRPQLVAKPRTPTSHRDHTLDVARSSVFNH